MHESKGITWHAVSFFCSVLPLSQPAGDPMSWIFDHLCPTLRCKRYGPEPEGIRNTGPSPFFSSPPWGLPLDSRTSKSSTVNGLWRDLKGCQRHSGMQGLGAWMGLGLAGTLEHKMRTGCESYGWSSCSTNDDSSKLRFPKILVSSDFRTPH